MVVLLTWLPDSSSRRPPSRYQEQRLHARDIYGLATVLSIGAGLIVGRLISSGWSVTRARRPACLFSPCGVLPSFS